MNLLIKFSGEFFTPQDALTEDGKRLLDKLDKNDRGYIVVGGGNRIRGRSANNYCRNASDNIGVISTLMNGYILQENMRQAGFKTELFSHFMDFGKHYTPNAAIESYNQGNWVILSSGLGKVGYISTDLSAVIKGLETKVDAVIKITQTSGIYDRDPKLPGANFLPIVQYDQVLEKHLAVMDFAAIAIAREHNLPIAIVDLENFDKFLAGKKVGSIIGQDWR